MSRCIAICLVFGLARLAHADAANADAQVDAGPRGVLTRPPALVTFVPAVYPPDAEAQRLQGEVLLQLDLDAQGHVADAQVLEPAGHGFDEAALAAVKQFVFSPAEIDGAPAPVRLTYRYAFTLAPEVPDAGATEPQHAVTFDGVAIERGTRKPLAYADVVVHADPDGGSERVVQTDEAGRFAFEDLAPGNYAVSVVATDHQRFDTTEQILAGQVTHATYYVRRGTYSEYETVVTGERERKDVARTTLKQEEIRLIPGTQGDALKVVENLPGVARAPYGLGLLVVRGSKPWDTRVYIDDAIVPQLFHFGGLTSVYNSDLLADITFQPGNFNVDHGRNIGGLVTATTRPPATDGFHGYLDVDVFGANFLLEGPITPELSFSISGRRSYIDGVLTVASKYISAVDFTLAPRYYDYQARLDWHPAGGKDRVALTLFGSDDRLALLLTNAAAIDPEARANLESHIGFHSLAGVWTHHFSSALTQRLSLQAGYNLFDNAFGSDISAKTSSELSFGRELFTWEATPQLSVDFGADALFAPYRYTVSLPQLYQFDEVPDPIASRQLVRSTDTGAIFEPGIFAQATWSPTARTRIVPGVRADYEASLRRFSVDPRLAAFQGLDDATTLKAAVGVYHQPPDYRQGLTTPTLGNPDLGLEGATQYMLGVERKLPWDLSLDVQTYFKWLFDQVETTDALVVRDGQTVPERFDNGGKGRSYGVEILFRKALTERLFGWISYSLEKTELCSSRFSLTGQRPQCSAFGSANWTPFPLDQPHHLIAVLSYKLPYDFIAGVRAQYASGNPVTPTTLSVYDADGDVYFPVPGAYFSERVPAFFQLDARVDKRFVFDRWMLTVYLDVQNVTNRHNPEYTIYNYNYTQVGYLAGLPTIPSLGVKGEF